MSKVHKVELFMLDVNDEFDSVKDIIEYLKCLNYSPSIRVCSSETKEFEWDDNVVINKMSCTIPEYKEFFDKL